MEDELCDQGQLSPLRKPSIPLVLGKLLGSPRLKQNAGMSDQAKAFVSSCMEGLQEDEIWDYHCHLFGTGCGCQTGPSGCSVVPLQHRNSRHHAMVAASGVKEEATADQDYLKMLDRLTIFGGKHVLLAFDKYVNPDGTVNHAKTICHTPDDYVERICMIAPDKYVPSCSVHPYRRDCIERLEKARARGVRIIKWLPNAMGIDPLAPVCVPFYEAVKRLDMVMLVHGGEERAVDSDDGNQELGNPLRMRTALDLGCKVIIAHCASLGMAEDLENDGAKTPCFDLFMRMMGKSEWKDNLFGDISAICLINRMNVVETLLAESSIHGRLLYGSDYPLVNLRVLNLTLPFLVAGHITAQQRAALNEIYDINPLMYDFCLKRSLRGKNGEAFANCVFLRNNKLF